MKPAINQRPRLQIVSLSLILAISIPVWAENTGVEEEESELTQLPSPAPEHNETLRNQAVEAHLALTDKATQSSWLGAGKARFLALKLPDSSGHTFANALILHDNLRNPDWPGVVRTLRKDLAKAGWNTLSIAVPDYLPTKHIPPLETRQPQTTEAELDTEATEPDAVMAAAESAKNDTVDQPAVNQGTAESTVPVPEQLDQRIRLAAQALDSDNSLPLVIIAVGSSATMVAKQAQELFLEDINGLVIIDPVPLPGLEGYDESLDVLDLRIPVLDLAPEFNPRADPKPRADNARRLQHDAYQQRILRGSNQEFSNSETRVVKAIRGWGETRFKR